MNIITGYRDDPHITSQQDRNTNISIFGSGVYILAGVGSEMAATVISANEVRISDGQMIAEGCTAEIPYGMTETLTLDNGMQGERRIDLIVARYVKTSETGVEDMSLAVIKGTPSASNPVSPAYTAGFIAAGDAIVEFPLYRINVDGISITSVSSMAQVVKVPSTEYVDNLRSQRIAAGYTDTAKSLQTNFTIIPMTEDLIRGPFFEKTSDGGYKALHRGILIVSASCYISGANSGDTVLVAIGRYKRGWTYQSTVHYALGPTTERECEIASYVMGVEQDEIVYLRARNVDGARGSVTNARLMIEFVKKR